MHTWTSRSFLKRTFTGKQVQPLCLQTWNVVLDSSTRTLTRSSCICVNLLSILYSQGYLRRKAGINLGNKLRTRQVILWLQIGIIKQTSPLDRLSKHTSAQEQTGRSTELSSELEHAMLAASKQVMQRWWLKSIREWRHWLKIQNGAATY